ncbi:MAG: hypothetical protein KF731_15685 [Thauera sp.]|nr:hypothetical protein [Thauera sp.]
MSTKASLKYGVDEASGMSAHLYEECLAPPDAAIFLEISGVSEVSVDVSPQGTTVTIAIARELAAKLGLVPPTMMER